MHKRAAFLSFSSCFPLLHKFDEYVILRKFDYDILDRVFQSLIFEKTFFVNGRKWKNFDRIPVIIQKSMFIFRPLSCLAFRTSQLALICYQICTLEQRVIDEAYNDSLSFASDADKQSNAKCMTKSMISIPYR